MSGQVFPQAYSLTRGHEGGFSDNPKDPGGATFGGITQVVYDHYRENKGLAQQSVRLAGEDELREIYKIQYWDTVSGDRLAAGLDYAVFDYAVNSGPEQAIKDLQRVVGAGVDGQMGEQTIALACAMPNVDTAILALCDRRMAFLKTLRTWSTFGNGWTRRVEGDQNEAQTGDNGVVDLAVIIHDSVASAGAGAVQEAPIAAPSAIGTKPGEVAGKGAPADVAVHKTPEGKGIIATVGGIGATALTSVGNIINQAQPYSDTATKAANTATSVAGAATTAAGAVVQIHGAAHKLFGVFDAVTLEVITGSSLLVAVVGVGFFGWYWVQSQREKAITAN